VSQHERQHAGHVVAEAAQRLQRRARGRAPALLAAPVLALAPLPALLPAPPPSRPNTAPGASAMRQTTVLANIWSIDRKNNVVALRGPKGNIVDVEVANPKIMQEIKVGDQVEAQYTEAALLGVTRLAK
jgi:hypothetical protein